MSVGFLPFGEIRNTMVDSLDKAPTRAIFSDTQNYENFSNIFILFHITWFLTYPRKCGTFSIDLAECEPQLFAKSEIVPGNVEPVMGGPIDCWQSDSWGFMKVENNTVNRMQAGEMLPRQSRKWRNLNFQIEGLKISLNSGNRSLMDYWKAASYVFKSM